MQANTVEQTKHFFRTDAETIMPLHEALVRTCCAGPDPPEDLAAILEDIGQDYVALSDLINQALRARRRALEPAA